jgi:Holliday junction resolvasome RuvABC endonuclease subunit
MEHAAVIGIDPGLVDSGIVVLEFHPAREQVVAQCAAIATDYDDLETTAQMVYSALSDMLAEPLPNEAYIFIEAYRERGQTYGTNSKMRELLSALRTVLPKAVVLDNMGVKKVITPQMMKALDLTGFPRTNHDDIQSAARIALLGMVKDDELNAVLYRVLRAAADGPHVTGWQIVRHW